MTYFTLAEMTRSQTAWRHGLSNEPNAEAVANLQRLITTLLDPLRQAYGKPLKVTSGYRSRSVNELVGGVSTSQHCFGLAADLDIDESLRSNLMRWLWKYAKQRGLPLDQAISEGGKDGWLHLSIPPEGRAPRYQFLIDHDGNGKKQKPRAWTPDTKEGK